MIYIFILLAMGFSASVFQIASKQRMQRILAFFLCVCLLCPISPFALADTIDDLPSQAVDGSEEMTGFCGVAGDEESVSWKLTVNDPLEEMPEDLTYTLTISGDGPMMDYDTPYAAPWSGRAIRECIGELIVENGVTAIGSYAFYGLQNLQKLEMADTVISIGESSFAVTGSDQLEKIYLPKSLEAIGVDAFLRRSGEFVVEESNPYFSSVDGVLYDDSASKIIAYPLGKRDLNYEIPDSVSGDVDLSLFWYSNVQNLIVPENANIVCEKARTINNAGMFGLSSIFNIYFKGNIPTDTSSWVVTAPWGGAYDNSAISCQKYTNPLQEITLYSADWWVGFGDQFDYAATNQSSEGEPLTYRSLDEFVITIDENGQVKTTGIGGGVITVTAPANEYYAETCVYGLIEVIPAFLARTEVQVGFSDMQETRVKESNLGDLVADAQCYYFEGNEHPADCAILNAGSIRSNLEAGSYIFALDCRRIFPFPNHTALISVTGQQLLDALEWGARYIGSGTISPRFLQVSSIKYTINTAIPSTVQVNVEDDTWAGSPTGPYRVTDVQIFDRNTETYTPLVLEKNYNLAGNDFMLVSCGDGYAMLAGCEVLDISEKTEEQVLADYLKTLPVDEKTGIPTITEDGKYGKLDGEGRITVIAEEPEPEPTPTPTPSQPSGGGSSGSSSPSYSIVAPSVSNGMVEFTPKRAEKGEEVTLTLTPDEGFQIHQVKVTDSNGTVLELTDLGEGMFTFLMPASKVDVQVEFAEIPPEPALEPIPVTERFTDITTSDWFMPAVQFVCDMGLMEGVSDQTFAPEVPITRAMLVTILHRQEGEPVTVPSAFADVVEGSYYASAVAWASENGLIKGFEDGYFHPDEPVTREQFATILYRYAALKGQNTGDFADLSAFVDVVQISPYAFPALRWANGAGLINGTDWGGLAPQAETSRAEAAQILMNYFQE